MTSTLAPDARRSVGLFSSGNLIADAKPKITFGKGKKSDDIVLLVSDMPVFRSGTFRDSMGFQHTWEDIHIHQMVSNFDYLLAQKVFEDVPVRKGHGSFLGDPMDSLIGWHSGVKAEVRTSKHDGEEYTYLLAEYEIFDKEAQAHIEGGHWRNRSSEVGFYLTNAEAEFWPVYQGFAYVDIPAIEGLNGFSKALSKQSKFSMMMEEEVGEVTTTPTDTKDQGTDAPSGGTSENTDTTTPPDGGGDSPPTTPPSSPEPGGSPEPSTPTPPSEPSPPAGSDPVAGTHSTSPNGVSSFTVGGKKVSDPAEVQNYINSLETAQQEQIAAARASFVKALAEGNKIPATQVDALTQHAQGLSPEQYTAWSASDESVPASPLFEKHGAEGGDGAGGPATSAKDAEMQNLRGIVAMHERTMTPEQVKETKSYKRLKELEGASSGNES